MISGKVAGKPLFFLVAMLCLVFALKLGALQPEISFYKTHVETMGAGGEWNLSAFAGNGVALIETPYGENATIKATFKGTGNAEGMSLAQDDRKRVAWLKANGKLVCGPCNESGKYPLSENGALVIEAQVERADDGARNLSGFFAMTPMLIGRRMARLNDAVEIEISGGWAAAGNGRIPSSFYFVDSPYHISKTGVVAEYLSRASLPWSVYPATSVVPPAAAMILFGVSAQYAYKICLIALFFTPVLLFYLFSRKLPFGQDSAFLFAVLLYFYLPLRTMLVGGGYDLFVEGMAARTAAIYLAMFFLYFSYEFLIGRKNALAIALVFFFASLMTNPKALFFPGIGIAMLCAYSILKNRGWQRPVLLLLSCGAVFFAAGLYFIEIAFGMDIGAGGGLGGVQIAGYEEGLQSFLVTSAFILPALFVAGAFFAAKERNGFVLWLAAFSAVVLIVATNPELNSKIPSFDGLRHMPVFYLCVFFISGYGAACLYSAAKKKFLSFVESKRMDRLTAVGAAALALGLPLGFCLIVAISSTPAEYAAPHLDLRIAAEYASLEKAKEIVGDERVVYLNENELSQYMIGAFDIVSGGVAYGDSRNATQLYETMLREKVKYAIFGNARGGDVAENAGLIGEYRSLAGDPRFEAVASEGNARLLRLSGHDDLGKLAYGDGIEFDEQAVAFDGAHFSGNCLQEKCKVLFFNALSQGIKCENSQGACTVKKAPDSSGWLIDGIGRGHFEVSASHEPDKNEFLAAVFGLGAVFLCFWASAKLEG